MPIWRCNASSCFLHEVCLSDGRWPKTPARETGLRITDCSAPEAACAWPHLVANSGEDAANHPAILETGNWKLGCGRVNQGVSFNVNAEILS
eukprot:177184-Prymnesium_polylepis.1